MSSAGAAGAAFLIGAPATWNNVGWVSELYLLDRHISFSLSYSAPHKDHLQFCKRCLCLCRKLGHGFLWSYVEIAQRFKVFSVQIVIIHNSHRVVVLFLEKCIIDIKYIALMWEEHEGLSLPP